MIRKITESRWIGPALAFFWNFTDDTGNLQGRGVCSFLQKRSTSVWSVLALDNKKMKINEWPRHGIQALWAALTNSHISGFITGKIYTGKLKNVCVPGLNCYSCPGARGACPIGSLQAVIGSWNFKMAYYVAGFLIFVGALLGRLVCGFLCPFGLIQDLLNKIPFPKKIRTFRGDKLLRKLKYVIFLVFVILLPMFVVDIMGQGAPYFCKLICPAGTLEGGIPLVLLNKSMRSAVGWLYIWKNTILVITIILSIMIYRPFCKYICPLGAFYSVFNKVSVFRYRVDKEKCVHCGKCRNICQMEVDPTENPNSTECIRCGRCKKICPTQAIRCGFAGKKLIQKNTKTVQLIKYKVYRFWDSKLFFHIIYQ